MRDTEMVMMPAKVTLMIVVLALFGTPERCRGAIDNVPAPLAAEPRHDGAVHLMAAGDSITWGDQGVRSYRGVLNETLGQRIRWVGPFADPRGRHAAWPGWTASELAVNLRHWLPEYAPDVVLLLVGTNDAGYRVPERCSISAMDGMIDTARRGGAWVFVSEILPRWQRAPDDGIRVEQLNATIKSLATSRDCFTRWIPQPGFRESHTVDGVHPNAEGERVIAANFLRAIERARCPNGVFD